MRLRSNRAARRPDGETYKQMDDDADQDGQDNGPHDSPVCVDNFGAAVGNGRAALERKDRQRHRRCKARDGNRVIGSGDRHKGKPALPKVRQWRKG